MSRDEKKALEDISYLKTAQFQRFVSGGWDV